MRILGVDYGSVRVGLALSDETGILATPLETVENAAALARIRAIISEKGVSKMVVGMPRNMNGSYGPKAEETRRFAEAVQRGTGMEIVFWDERLSTRGVERALIHADISRKKRRQVLDKLAAQQILQNYLDARSSAITNDSRSGDAPR